MSVPTYTEIPVASPSPGEDPSNDLGFGSEVARGVHKRLLNRDGSFNVVRYGLNPLSALSFYHWSLSISWPKFLGFLSVSYLVINTLFAFAYLACGSAALAGPPTVNFGGGGRFSAPFFQR